MTDRIHRFDDLDNFRDFGNYDTASGRRLKTGHLFRAGHQARVSDADLERLEALNIATVVDLRRPSERRDQPSRRWAGFDGLVIESDLDDGGEAPHMKFLREAELTPVSGRAFMIDTYRTLPFDEGHLDTFSRYFRALGDSGRPVLIHLRGRQGQNRDAGGPDPSSDGRAPRRHDRRLSADQYRRRSGGPRARDRAPAGETDGPRCLA
jgi:protein-tyrosine phosphatase